MWPSYRNQSIDLHSIWFSVRREVLHQRRNRSQMFFKVGVFKNFPIFPRNHLCWSLFSIKVAGLKVFSGEYCEIFKNSCFYKIPPVAAFVIKNVAFMMHCTKMKKRLMENFIFCIVMPPLSYCNLKHALQRCIHYGSSHQRCSVKKGVLKISQNSQENTCVRGSFLIKL